MTKATHNGTCQVCGRQHASKFGGQGIAKHGYTVKGFGFFKGTCPGSGHWALELDRDLTDRTIVQLEAAAAANEALTLDDITAVVVTVRGRSAWDPKTTTTLRTEAEYDAFTATARGWYGSWTEARNGRLRSLHAEARMLRAHVRELVALIAARHGQPLLDRK